MLLKEKCGCGVVSPRIDVAVEYGRVERQQAVVGLLWYDGSVKWQLKEKGESVQVECDRRLGLPVVWLGQRRRLGLRKPHGGE